MASRKSTSIYNRIRQILESARASVARSVNTTQVVANWLVVREIVEEEQKGERRAGYGQRLLQDLSARLSREYGTGYSVDNLEAFRHLYLQYPRLISETPSRKFDMPVNSETPRRNSRASPHFKAHSHLSEALLASRVDAARWQPGTLHPSLSWSHYRRLLRVEHRQARSFYEIEAIQNHWSVRELARQINSLLFERLALSRDKAGLLRLAKRGQEVTQATDVFKDPVVMEFLGLPKSPRLAESEIEEALINNLQAFLLELGKGFAFVSRQERITLDGDHFYIDLVFYHTILKCYVMIDLKVSELTHADLGQIQFYVNYFDRERRMKGDNPTLGLVLCADKNDAVVRYTLGPHQEKKIFASRYKLHLPTEAELKAEIRRELKLLQSAEVKT